jgi:hypothetical protein
MQLRYETVIRNPAPGSDMDYSLVLTDDGVFLICAGSALYGELLRSAADAALNRSKLEPNCVFIPYGQIMSVVARLQEAESSMFIKTRSGNYNFVFQAENGDQLQALIHTITERRQQ